MQSILDTPRSSESPVVLRPSRTTVHLPLLTTGPSKWIPVTCLLKRRYRANRWPGAKTADASDDAGLRVADNIVRRI